MFIPGTCLSSIIGLDLSQTRSFPIKTRVIWVPGMTIILIISFWITEKNPPYWKFTASHYQVYVYIYLQPCHNSSFVFKIIRKKHHFSYTRTINTYQSTRFRKKKPRNQIFISKEWLKQSNGNEGCYAAVGSIDHSIQLWNLEEADPLEAAQVLGVLDVEVKGVNKNLYNLHVWYT